MRTLFTLVVGAALLYACEAPADRSAAKSATPLTEASLSVSSRDAGPVVDSAASPASNVPQPADTVTTASQDPGGASLRSPSVLFRIGVVEGDANYVLGQIGDVAVDTLGNVFLLDGQALNVRWYGPNGAHIHTVGRAGGGPGEFRGPVAIALSPDGSVNVLDAVQQRITRFARSDSALTLVKVSPVPLFGMDFCILGGNTIS